MAERGSALTEIYQRLHTSYANKTWHWSPEYVRGPMDVIAGVILVQHTTWQNAERALEAMRESGALDARAILSLSDDELQQLVRVSGTPSVKARRLRAIAVTIEDAGGLDAFLARNDDDLRRRLFATHGVGPESAAAIMLYAAGRRTFVIDAYTRRMFGRAGLTPEADVYEAWRRFFEEALLAGDAAMFQRYHAFIVLHSKAICRATPRCGVCPITDLCETGRDAANQAGMARRAPTRPRI
jgi:endonuclease-3 related protein